MGYKNSTSSSWVMSGLTSLVLRKPMDEQRRLLDELMGQERNLEEQHKRHHVRHFSDADICKFYIAGVSPYNLFKNTKSDLGNYDKEFDDECRDAFQV